VPVAIHTGPFDAFAELAAAQATLRPGSYGACCSFLGSMRDFNPDLQVERMYLEHYPGMTEGYLNDIIKQADARRSLQHLLLLHRVGEVTLGEAIVLVAAWSRHRADAFEAARYMIEELKSRAPFWKKEYTPKGERWVATNTPRRPAAGPSAAAASPADEG